MFEIDAPRLALAAQWAIDLDYSMGSRISAAGFAEKRIPLEDPVAIREVGGAAAEESYRRDCPSVGALLRPLLLPANPESSALFPYQRVGTQWLLDHARGVLADDMGLGKTVQVIAAMQLLFRQGRIRSALVVAPRSMINTWSRELESWAPELSTMIVLPSAGSSEAIWDFVLERVHVAITSYEQLRNPAHRLESRPVELLVADEAHRVRNMGSQSARGFQKINYAGIWALTGTPIERDTEDLATLLSLVDPRRFSPDDSKEPASTLSSRARPYILRREKADVLAELPEVIEKLEMLELRAEQRSAYDLAAARAGRGDANGDDVLKLINELRVICDYDPETHASAKIDRILEVLSDIQRAGEKVVVFSTLIEPLNLLANALDSGSERTRYSMLVGSMSLPDRDAVLSRFRSDEHLTALLASSRVAGEGLTLTEANHVIFFNEWWNPSTNDQARDRVVRIGQQRGVYVYRFRCIRTIEVDLARIIERKESVVDDFVGPLTTKGQLSEAELGELAQSVTPSSL